MVGQTAGKTIAVVGTIANALLNFRSDLIVDLVARGHKVLAFASDYNDKSRQRVLELGAIPVDYQISRASVNPFSDLVVVWRLRQLFRKHQVDVTLCYFVKPVIYGNIAAWLARVPFRSVKIEGLGWVFTNPPEQASWKLKLLRYFQIQLYRFSLPKAHQVFLLNPDDKADLIDQYKIKTRQLTLLDGIGVNLASFPQHLCWPERLRFIFVGRLLKEKGIRYFLAAAQQIRQHNPEVEFIVLGEPDDAKGSINRAELKQWIANGTVQYPGQVSNVAHWLQNSSVFVLPSYYREGVPRSTQEALATGRAIITTDSPGCRETVQHGKNGLLIPPHDINALVAAMRTFIEQPALVESMGGESRAIAQQRFDVKRTNQKIIMALGLSAADTQAPGTEIKHEQHKYS